MEFGAALANYDHASSYGLAVMEFYAQALSVGISAQPGRTTCFFMGHILIIEVKRLINLVKIV